MNALLHSKAFWTAVVDFIVGVVFLGVGKLYPENLDLVKQIWVMLQPIVAAVFLAFFGDEFSAKVARAVRGWK